MRTCTTSRQQDRHRSRPRSPRRDPAKQPAEGSDSSSPRSHKAAPRCRAFPYQHKHSNPCWTAATVTAPGTEMYGTTGSASARIGGFTGTGFSFPTVTIFFAGFEALAADRALVLHHPMARDVPDSPRGTSSTHSCRHPQPGRGARTRLFPPGSEPGSSWNARVLTRSERIQKESAIAVSLASRGGSVNLHADGMRRAPRCRSGLRSPECLIRDSPGPTIRHVHWELFEGVPATELQPVLELARRRTFRRGEIVFHQGDPADSLHLVVRGRFAIARRTARGEDALLAISSSGDVFGELALVSGRERSATVSALEAGETLCVYRVDFEDLRTRHASVDRVLVTVLARQLQRMNELSERGVLRERSTARPAPAPRARTFRRRERRGGRPDHPGATRSARRRLARNRCLRPRRRARPRLDRGAARDDSAPGPERDHETSGVASRPFCLGVKVVEAIQRPVGSVTASAPFRADDRRAALRRRPYSSSVR